MAICIERALGNHCKAASPVCYWRMHLQAPHGTVKARMSLHVCFTLSNAHLIRTLHGMMA